MLTEPVGASFRLATGAVRALVNNYGAKNVWGHQLVRLGLWLAGRCVFRPGALEALSNRLEIVETIKTIYTGPKNAGAVGNNGWAAWNAVVEYLDHHRDGTPEERALTSMDETSWVTKRKLAAQQAVLSLR